MSSASCWRGLARPSQRLLLAPVAAAAPSTSAAFSTAAQPWAKASDSSAPRHVRTGKKLVLGRKKKQVERGGGKPPLPGERKAFRKRIVLSNNNALEVAGLPKFSPSQVLAEDAVGKVHAIPAELVDKLRACEAFKPSQNWSLFRSPHMLVRKETVELVKQMTETIQQKQTQRLVIDGMTGAGKSILGLQALVTGFQSDCVVISLPEGQDLTSGGTEYSPIPNTDMYSQPVYTVKLMQTIYQTNFDILARETLKLPHLHLSIATSQNMTLAQLLNATKEPDFAWPVFQAFWKEMLLPGRPPIVFALDGLSHIMQMSAYRSPTFAPIHSHDLSLLRMFTDALSGKMEFVNGAVIIGVMNGNNAPKNPSLSKALAQRMALQNDKKPPAIDPYYRKYDKRVFDSLQAIKILTVEGLSKPEARALMEYWAASGILRLRIDERNVTEKWTMSGGGVLAELERVSLFDIREGQF